MTHREVAIAPFLEIPGDETAGLILLADHARNALPEAYGNLGLPDAEFERHIAYDIGVERVTRHLARLLGAPAVLAGFSRLLIDPNRGDDDPTLIRQLYDGTVIPANYPMAPAEREKRLAEWHRPYHEAVAAGIARVRDAAGTPPFVVSIHSFTPSMQGRLRPWHVGLLWDTDPRAALPLIEMLSADPTLIVGDNEPYDGALRGDTMFRHALVPGYPHALIEIRQDLIAEESGALAWAERLAPMLDALNRRDDIHQIRRFGSRTGPL